MSNEVGKIQSGEFGADLLGLVFDVRVSHLQIGAEKSFGGRTRNPRLYAADNICTDLEWSSAPAPKQIRANTWAAIQYSLFTCCGLV